MSARAPEPGRGFRGSRRAAPRAGALNRASRARRDQHCSGAPVSTAPVVVLTGAAQWRDPASAVSRSSTGLRPMAGGSAADPRLDLVQKMRPSDGADSPSVCVCCVCLRCALPLLVRCALHFRVGSGVSGGFMPLGFGFRFWFLTMAGARPAVPRRLAPLARFWYLVGTDRNPPRCAVTTTRGQKPAPRLRLGAGFCRGLWFLRISDGFLPVAGRRTRHRHARCRTREVSSRASRRCADLARAIETQ